MILDIFLILLCVILLLACVFWAYLLVFVIRYKVPLISTHFSVVETMVGQAGLTKNQTVYDLGCGFAPMLFLAAQKNPENTFIGVEVLRPILWINRFRARLKRVNIRFENRDFFTLDLSRSDVIFCYLWDTIMDRIYTDIWPNLKPGTKLISHDFPIKKLTPEQRIKVGKSTVYVYVKN